MNVCWWAEVWRGNGALRKHEQLNMLEREDVATKLVCLQRHQIVLDGHDLRWLKECLQYCRARREEALEEALERRHVVVRWP